MTPVLRSDKLDPEPSLPDIYYDCVRLNLTNVSLVIWSIASQYLFRVPKDPSRHAGGLRGDYESISLWTSTPHKTRTRCRQN